jgi:2-methylisocitrate lyase-like PEP mutase family enzyme
MDRKPEIQELSAADVDQVAGGMMITAFVMAAVRAALKGSSDGGSAGGQNDQAQQFQLIMEQLTPGPG